MTIKERLQKCLDCPRYGRPTAEFYCSKCAVRVSSQEMLDEITRLESISTSAEKSTTRKKKDLNA